MGSFNREPLATHFSLQQSNYNWFSKHQAGWSTASRQQPNYTVGHTVPGDESGSAPEGYYSHEY